MAKKVIKKLRDWQSVEITTGSAVVDTEHFGQFGANADHILRIALCATARSDYLASHYAWGAFIDGWLHRPSEREKKDGPAVIFAEMHEFRTNEHAHSVSALAYEIDGKLSLEQVKARLEALGFEAVAWTTHNHLRTKQPVRLASFKKWHLKTFGINGAPTDEGVCRYCAENKRHDHLTSVRLHDNGTTRRVHDYGQQVEVFDVAHDPEHKLRIVFPLKQALALKDGTFTIADFKAIYHAFGKQVFGEAYSTESSNPARLHYMPSHPPRTQGSVLHFPGALVDHFDVWKRVEPTVKAAKTSASKRGAFRPVGLDELEHVLKSIPSDLERPDWFKAIAAIFHETGGTDAGAQLAHEWSSGDPRYDFDEVEGIWEKSRFKSP